MIATLAFRAVKLIRQLLPAFAIVASLHSAAHASPDCSNPGPRPSAACVAKIDDCKKTSIVYVLAVLGRQSGLAEKDNLSRLASNTTNEVWYARNSKFVGDTVHMIYTDERAYKKLRAGIAPNMALALSKLISGCSADTSVKVDAQ